MHLTIATCPGRPQFPAAHRHRQTLSVVYLVRYSNCNAHPIFAYVVSSSEARSAAQHKLKAGLVSIVGPVYTG